MEESKIELVYQALKDKKKPAKPADLIKMTGLSKTEISEAIKILKNKGRVYSPKRCYYQAN